MSDPGSVGGSRFVQQWIKTALGTEGVDIFHPSQIPSETSQISKAERKRAEYILSIAPPPPQINFAIFQDIFQRFNEHFNIARITGNNLASFGIAESSLLLGVVGSWVGAQAIAGNLLNNLANAEGKNPVDAALHQYINKASITPTDVRSAMASLRKLPLTFAAFKSANPSLVAKAFTLAEQQAVLAVLDKWVEAEAESAEEMRKEMKELDIQLQELMQRLLKEYITEIQEKQKMMTQPVLSVLISSLALGPMIIAPLSALIPALGATTPAGAISAIPSALAPELAAFAAGMITTTIAWATPVAMTLSTQAGGGSIHQRAEDASKAYAMTLSQFITSPQFSQMLSGRLNKAVAKGLISKAQAKLLNISFKTSLLLTAMAALYKAQAGGLTAQELLDAINGKLKLEEGNFLNVLVKLINEQLSGLKPQERTQMLNELLTPYDNEHDALGELIDPISSFISLWDPKFLQEMNLANPS